MIGRRLPDTRDGDFPIPYDDLRPGDAWKVLDRKTGEPVVVTDEPSNLTGQQWTVIAPGPNDMKLIANLRAHTVREHDDGTISVRPGDGSSNSILVQRRPDESWHGYIEHNEWRPC
jgi:hypothetical protein